MRTRLVAGNWKMNLTSREGTALLEAFVEKANNRPDLDIVVCPSYTSLQGIGALLKKSGVKLGAQDVFWEDKGAFTGQVSAAQLSDHCVAYCIVGHSEKRGRFGGAAPDESQLAYFSDTAATITPKIQALINYGITPIHCVGETKAERDAGQTDAVIASQLEAEVGSLHPDELYFYVIAYEPVWAIGTGETCSAEEANRVCGMIRQWFVDKMGAETAETLRVLYGGSVKGSNARELFDQPEIDGGLVGGASLNSEEFTKIVMEA